MANSFFFNASSWHQIDLLYDHKVINALNELQPQVIEPETFARFIELIQSRQPHKVLGAVERTKRQFVDNNKVMIELPFVGDGLNIAMTDSDFQTVSQTMCDDIIRTANLAVTNASLTKTDIDTVYVTGGSMGIIHLHNMVKAEYPNSKLIDGDRSTAVARGLALDAKLKFA